MNETDVVRALAALAQPLRLRAFRALVVAGHMWLTAGQETRELQPGDEFRLDKNTPHAELYGPEGATYWAARKN